MDFVIWLIIIIVAAALLQISATNNKKKKMEKILGERSDFSATQKIMGCDGNSGIAIDETRKKVGLISNEFNIVSIRVFSYRDLLCSEIFEDGSTITKTVRTSQVGGALVGGLLFGGVGAVIGGLSGKTETTGKIKKIDLRLTVNDTKNPIHDVAFQNVEGNKGGLIHKAAMKQARHWHSLIEVLIKRADMEDKSSTQQIAQIAPPASIADELKKLAELQVAGILSAEEFQQQKVSLLKNKRDQEGGVTMTVIGKAEWYYLKLGQRKKYGPHTEDDMALLITTGTISKDIGVWKPSFQKWIPLEKSELSKYLNAVSSNSQNNSSTPIHEDDKILQELPDKLRERPKKNPQIPTKSVSLSQRIEKSILSSFGWIFSAFFLFIGAAVALEGNSLGCISFLLLSVFFLPPARNFLSNLKLSTKTNCYIVLGLIILGLITQCNVDNEKKAKAEQERVLEEDKIRKDKIKAESLAREERIDEFNKNAKAILIEAKAAFDTGNFEALNQLTTKYQATENAELKTLTILTQLQSVASGDFKKQQMLYQKLVSLNPSVLEYKKKLDEIQAVVKQQEAEQLRRQQDEETRKKQQATAERLISNSNLLSQIEVRLKENAKSLGKFYGTPDQLARARQDINILADVFKFWYDDSMKSKEAKAIRQRADVLLNKVSEQARQIYASALENGFLKKDIEMTVGAIGKDKKQLRFSYALMSKSLAYQTQNSEIIMQAAELGFTKVIYTNSITGDSWTYNMK
jgi:hypothetical protein